MFTDIIGFYLSLIGINQALIQEMIELEDEIN